MSASVDVREALAGWCNEKNIGKAEYERRSAVYDEMARLRELAGCMYAGPAAVHDMPECWLDALYAASEGRPFSCGDLLPYTSDGDAQ